MAESSTATKDNEVEGETKPAMAGGGSQQRPAAPAHHNFSRRATTTGIGEQHSQNRQWASNFSRNTTTIERGEQPMVGSGIPPPRYSRTGAAAERGKPPMRRSRSSMLQSLSPIPAQPGRYGHIAGSPQSPSRQLSLGNGVGLSHMNQTYPVRKLGVNRMESSASVFSRGAAATSPGQQQRFIAMSENDIVKSGDANDDVFSPNAWAVESPSLHIYAKQLQHPSSGIPSKTQTVKGVQSMVFNGSDAAEWFMLSADGIFTADQAQVLGQKLVDLGLIASVDENAPNFKVSSSTWFYFCHQSNFTKSEEKTGDEKKKTGLKEASGEQKTESKTCIIL